MKKIIVYGDGLHGDLVYALFKEEGYEVVAFTVEKDFLTKKGKFGLPFVPFEEVERVYPPSEYDMFIGIGPHQLNSIREKFYHKAKEKGYSLPTFKSKLGHYPSDIVCGDNCWLDNASASHPFVEIGNNVVLIASNIGHNTMISDHCFITSSIIGGGVIIEENVFIGMGSIIQSGLTIGRGSIIGLGSVIKKNVEPYSVYSVPRTKPREGMDSREIKLF